MDEKNLQSFSGRIRSNFDENSQVVETKLVVGEHELSVFYIDGLIDKNLFSQSVMFPLERLASGAPKIHGILKYIQTKEDITST